MRKKVDQRIRTLVENGVKLHQRSMFVIVGDRGRDQARGRGAVRRLRRNSSSQQRRAAQPRAAACALVPRCAHTRANAATGGAAARHV
jgi:hypothetical protein